jgi:uncharacterized protein (TIRG00374 family)
VKARSLMLAIGSVAIAVVLVLCLISIARIDPRDVLRKLRDINLWAFACFVLLMGLHIFLASQKWRLIDRVMRRSGDAALTQSTSFAVSSVGIALGQVLPPSIAMVVARTTGTYVYGRPVTRGTVGTVFEQGFDFLIICFLIPASLLTRASRGGQWMWIGVAVSTGLFALMLVDPLIRWLQSVTSFIATRKTTRFVRLQRSFLELQVSGLLDSRLARKLMLLSMLRFLILVLMAGQATRAIGIEIPLWHLAAAMPFVVFSSVVALTPGGIGVSELTYATALKLFGTPLSAAAQFSLANRFLVATASFIVAICALGLALAMRRASRRSRKATTQAVAQP